MTGAEVIRKVKELNLPEGTFLVFSSGLLAALGIREANDIDLGVTESTFELLKGQEGWSMAEKNGKELLVKDDFEAHPILHREGYATRLEQAIESAIFIYGVPFMNMDELKKFKTALGREKDLKDLELIAQYESKTR